VPRPRVPLPEGFGVVAGLWSAAIGLAIVVVPMLIAWIASTGSGLTWLEALRIGGLIWVVAQGTSISLSGIEVSLLPLALTAIPLLLLGYAGAWSARRAGIATWSQVARLTTAGAVTYTLIAVVVSRITFDAASRTNAVSAGVHAAALAVLALGWGSSRGAGVWPDPRVPGEVRAVLRAGGIATAAILAAGAAAAVASLVAHFDEAMTMSKSLSSGLGGGLALTLLGIGYVPVVAVWGSAYLLGAGVVIAPLVTLTPFVPVPPPAELPPFPLLAALPPQAPVFAWALPVVGVLAGVLAGTHLGRTCREQPRLLRLALAVGAAAVAGALMALAAWLASGALGTDRLVHLGPTPGTVGVLAAVLVVVGAVPSAVAAAQSGKPPLRVARTRLGRRRPTVAAPASAPPDVDPAGGGLVSDDRDPGEPVRDLREDR